MTPYRLFMLVSLTFVAACSSELTVRDVGNELEAGSSLDGIPFRIAERFRVELYQKSETGYRRVHQETKTLANPEKLYVLDFKAAAFNNNTSMVALNEDGTISKVSLDEVSQFDEALTALGEQGLAVAQAQVAREEARKKARDEEQATTKADREGEQDRQLAALEARQAADLALVKLENLPKDASEVARIEARLAVELARTRANILAERAGLPEPFSETTLPG